MGNGKGDGTYRPIPWNEVDRKEDGPTRGEGTAVGMGPTGRIELQGTQLGDKPANRGEDHRRKEKHPHPGPTLP